MRKFFFVIILFFLLVVYIYMTSISNIPVNILLFEEEKMNFKTFFGVNIDNINDYEVMQTSGNIENETLNRKQKYKVNLFNMFNIKDITVSVIPKTYVLPCGNTIGLKLYTNGVLVVGMSEIEDYREVTHKPYDNSGLKEGDMIVQINQNEITCTTELINSVNSSNGNILEVLYVRDNKLNTATIKPVKIENNNYKIGLWVRDAALGVGTATFYEPQTKAFGALGHGITDIDTGELISISNGELLTTDIVSIKKGEKGMPRRIKRLDY